MGFLKKPYIIAGLLAIGLAGVLYVKFVSPTNVAFINFTDSQYAQILQVKDNPFIRVKRISFKQGKIPGLEKYTAIYIFGMGLNLNEKQMKSIRAAMNKGSKVYVYAATSSGSDLTNLAVDNLKYIEACFSNGGRRNMQALLNYSRRVFDGKTFFSRPMVKPQIIPRDVFFHLGEEEYFATRKGYQKFYETKGYFKPEGAKVCILTTNLGPRNRNNRAAVDALIRDLEARGINVYPAAGFMKRLDAIKAVGPDLVVLMPHGRLALGRAAEAVAYLKEKNIPLLCPIHIYGPYDEWVKSQQGMAGGMLSQSIVMPELDGGIDPYVIGAQFKNKDGLYVFEPILERIKLFGSRVEKWIKLQRLPNSEKKVAIVYYKGPGLNAMAAGGLEVAPSLLNLLRRLQQQGFDTGVLPESAKALMAKIQKEGPVLGVYAKGTFKKYLKNGNPKLIPVPTYSNWCQQHLQPEMVKDIEANYGPAPGEYMQVEKDGEDYIAVARIRFGNVVILPQPLPGYGENESRLIHGAKKAPPHSYAAAYLWIRNGFKADAIVHFGTHGSLEFTPWKQAALSQYDWPDALIGDLPHPYIYVINNIGEAMIAKRRSYAVIASHLTPPFTEADLYGKLSDLHDALHSYFNTESKALKQEYRETIKTLVYKMELHKDLELEEKEERNLSEAAIHKIHNHIHALEQEKITRGLYILGRSYRKSDVYETVRLMAIDALAYSRARLDRLKGKIKAEDVENQHKFDAVYRQKAFTIIDNILLRDYSPAGYLDKQDLARLAAWEKEHAKPSADEMMASMMAMAMAGQGKKKKAPEKAEKTGLGQVKALVLKIAPDLQKQEFILSLKNGKNFMRASALLDPESMKKAVKIAKYVPAMQEKLELFKDPNMLELVGFMQKPKSRGIVFNLLEDKNMRELIRDEQKKLMQQAALKALEPDYTRDIFLAISPKKNRPMIAGWPRKRLLIFKNHIGFYLENKDLAGEISKNGNKDAQAVAAVLQSKKALEEVETAVRLADRKIAEWEAREEEYVAAVRTYRDTLFSIKNYYAALKKSTSEELAAITRALSGGYLSPSSGGDPIGNPQAVPTGRNLFAIDAEKTPTKEAWKVAVKLADALIAAKLSRTGKYPQKVAFTLWGGEFIRAKGINLAQIFYLLGVEPVRNSRGAVHDVRLIPMEKLKRPRIDVVVQTSGQFRDIAASRVYLINKAVDLAGRADDGDQYENHVKAGTIKAEAIMKAKGLSPEQARKFAAARVFGGVNGNYGTAIMGKVESGDKWEDEKEITSQYLKNMGAVYTKENWGFYQAGIFEGALQNTDTVVHPRSSNTYGPLSLDHYYEFMGGLNAVVRQVTGNDPEAFFNDLRNRYNPRVQGVKEAIWVEARTTIFNPKYIKDLQAGGASSAEVFAETVRNTYGWNVMKPNAIDKEIWEGIDSVYIRDKYKLGMEKYFRDKNPYALQEITAVMLETVRKGYWQPDAAVIKRIAELHARLVIDHKAGCSGFVCDNAKLQAMIQNALKPEQKADYKRQIDSARVGETGEKKKGMELKKEKMSMSKVKELVKENMTTVGVVFIILLLFSAAVIVGMARHRK